MCRSNFDELRKTSRNIWMLNLLYGKENFDKMNNANMLDATIELIYFLMYC